MVAIFWRVFVSCISASRVQHVSDLHLKFALRPHEVWQTAATAEISRGRKKQKKKIEEETTRHKYNGVPYSIARP